MNTKKSSVNISKINLKDVSISNNHDNTHTEAVGTAIYRAPEQENSRHYDYKADMFSLGIIIFEMWYNKKYSTCMERNMTLLALRNEGKFPEDFDS